MPGLKEMPFIFLNRVHYPFADKNNPFVLILPFGAQLNVSVMVYAEGKPDPGSPVHSDLLVVRFDTDSIMEAKLARLEERFSWFPWSPFKKMELRPEGDFLGHLQLTVQTPGEEHSSHPVIRGNRLTYDKFTSPSDPNGDPYRLPIPSFGPELVRVGFKFSILDHNTLPSPI